MVFLVAYMFMSIGWWRRFDECAPLPGVELDFIAAKSMSEAPFRSLATSSSAYNERMQIVICAVAGYAMRIGMDRTLLDSALDCATPGIQLT